MNAKPVLEVKTRRVGGANYQVPVGSEQFPQAIAWRFAGFASTRARRSGKKTMTEQALDELIDAANLRAAQSRRRKTCTAWRKRTSVRALPLVIAGRIKGLFRKEHGQGIQTRDTRNIGIMAHHRRR